MGLWTLHRCGHGCWGLWLWICLRLVGVSPTVYHGDCQFWSVLSAVIFIQRSLIVFSLCLTCIFSLLVGPVNAADLSPAPESAEAYIISPGNGDTVQAPFTVQFGLSGMGIAPAGIDRPNTGHHHLLVDVDELPPLTEPLQGSEQVLHYGAGQTETQLTLEPGEHTLQLVLGNYGHVPHDSPVISEKITVSVQ